MKVRMRHVGFTFIEIVVSMVIFSFMVLAIFSVLNVGDKTWRSESILVELQQQVRLAIDGMTRELRQSRSSGDITISGGNTQIDFYHAGSATEISYYLSNNQIIREHPAGTTKVLANNITSLTFSQSGDVITIQVQAQKIDRGGTRSFALTEKVRVRNG